MQMRWQGLLMTLSHMGCMTCNQPVLKRRYIIVSQ